MTLSTLHSEKLTHLPAIWARMRRGAHLHPGDGELYYALRAEPEHYAAAFALFGLRLIDHPAQFFYLEGDESLKAVTERRAELMALAFVLIDSANTAGQTFSEAFFPAAPIPRKPSDFNLFRTQQHREVLSAAGIKDNTGAERTFRFMARLGMVRYELGSVTFLLPFYRMRDVCLQISKLGEEGLDQLAATAATTDTEQEQETEDEA